jgi:ABC-2 type transport system ATP-binding protein
MIEADALTKRYGSLRALDKVSFEVHRGEVVGFLGPNGAGKSTTMRILTCFISASGGSAKVHGYDVFDDPLEVRRRVGYLPQRAPLYGDMSVWEYLHFVSDMRGLEPSTFKKRMKGIVEVCGLAQVLGKDIRDLSHGYRQRVGLGQALVHDPPILILDEPTADLDPNEKAEVIRYIREIGKDRTILLSTHNLTEVEAACARAIIVSKGRVVADGPLDEIRGRSQKVRYVVTVDEQATLATFAGGPAKKAPSAQEVQAALAELPKVANVTELPTDDKAHRFQLQSGIAADLRGEIFRLMVDKGWMLLELRRDAQSLEDVFKTLTKGDERQDRGRRLVEEDDEDEDDNEASASASSAASSGAGAGAADEEDEDEEDEDEDEGDAEDEGGDDDEEEEEEEVKPKKAPKKG